MLLFSLNELELSELFVDGESAFFKRVKRAARKVHMALRDETR